MTSKAVISQLEVNERRLKGIYDQLESGNFKKAIFEAEKVLKKNANLLPAKVLKGLALYRLGKSFEAFQLIDEVAKLTPTDENTLNSLSYFYKESNQKMKIVEIYEEAYRKCPSREDICANLFYCHIKNFDYGSQQKIAAQLKKINVNHMEYVMWPIIANVLHGVYHNDERLLKLGEATLLRYVKSSSIMTPEIVEFLLFTLEKMGKLTECLHWFNSNELKDIVENNQNELLFNRYKISILQKLERKEEACDICWKILKDNPEDVCMWREYIDMVMETSREQNNPHSVASLVKNLGAIEKQSMSIKVAKIHLSMKLEKSHFIDFSREFGSKIGKIIDYFIEFGDKPSCLFDIYYFMAVNEFSPQDRRSILDQLIDTTGPLTLDNLKSTKDIERHVFVETLKRAVAHDNKTETSLLLSCYEHGLQFSSTLSISEIKPCDNFVKLAALSFYDDWLKDASNPEKSIVELISLLKKCIGQSPANYHLRLILSHLLGLVCCHDLLIEQFNELEIKQLIWDSLGYFFVLRILDSPSFDKRIQFLQKNIDRKQKNKQEIEDSLVTCYKLGNYCRIPEIIDFYRDIEVSCISKLSEIEILYINTVLNCHSHEDLFEFFSSINNPDMENCTPDFLFLNHYSNLKDFRDLKTSPDFCQFEKMWTDEDQKKSFESILLWISHRHAVIQSYFSAAKFTMETVVKLDRLGTDSKLSFESETSSHYKVLQSSQQQLIDISNRLIDNCGSYKNLSVSATGCPDLPYRGWGQCYVDIVTGCINSMVTFHDVFVRRLPEIKLNDWNKTLLAPVKTVADRILNSDDDNGDIFSIVPDTISQCTMLGELLAILAMTLSLMENMMKPLRPQVASKRKNKKKKNETNHEIVVDPKNELLKSFCESTNFHKLPSQLIDTVTSVIDRISILKSKIDSDWKPKLFNVPTIGDSWVKSLDDSLKLFAVKKATIDNIKKQFEDESPSGSIVQ